MSFFIKYRAVLFFMNTDFLSRLTRLRTDANRSLWTEVTFFRAPHKPFLLLSVMDIAAQGQLTSSFVEPSFDLIERFARYWDLVQPPGGQDRITQDPQARPDAATFPCAGGILTS
ncbi:hypothetical protein [Desulfonatronovibrio hydrogenovorans]|uniref:hypothetical protein n=1 Tax=Desulfonatronovibrio hydrogenovorans TaxID=53245 RepID=UPI0012376E06|nr:hypothetical protein [Desulfonatronovibrio hydrogenovorans]